MDYDIAIIGAGSAGATLAGRIAEDSKCSVLLVEAGPDYSNLDQLPEDLKNSSFPASTGPHVWNYKARGNDQQSEPILVPYGKVTGGSSAVNGVVFLRGLPEDYDTWSALGNIEWSFEKVLPYFRKLETDLDFAGPFHGKHGPISVQRTWPRNMAPSMNAFYKACRSIGFPDNLDMNLPDNTGVGPRPLNNLNGIRISTALAYLNPMRHKSNLTIKSNTVVRRILFQKQRAVGLEVRYGRESFQIKAREIVVSAGVVKSPSLLMHSGVGSVDVLRNLGIGTIVHHLPGIGSNLRDHPAVDLWFQLKKDAIAENVPSQVCLRYTSPNSTCRNDMIISPSRGVTMWDGTPYIQFRVVLESASTAGSLTLESLDPEIQPGLNYQYLSDRWDLQRMRDGIHLAISLGGHKAFKELIADLAVPGKKHLVSPDALDRWILDNVTTTYHAGGTCKMGTVTDQQAVVDQYCRVHGLAGLRIVDASIMPDVVRANSNATVVMIAERVADWIKLGTPD